MKGTAVPACERHVYAPKRTRYCLIVFVLNEGKKFLDQLDTMRPLAERADIVIADGGSNDGATAEPELRARGVRALLVKTGPGRLGAQMRMAFSWALSEGYEGVVTIDGNGKDDPSTLLTFLEALDRGADHVQGSRFIPGGHSRNTPWLRYLGIRLIHAPLISIASGFHYTDTTNGFRAYSARLLADERVDLFREVFNGYELHYYLAIRAARLEFAVREVPVTRVYPPSGPAPTKIRGVRANVQVLSTLVKVCLGRFDPPVRQ